MKLLNLPLVLLVFFVVQVQPAEAQKTELKHTFKIVGNKRIPFYSKEACEMSVEYDTTSIDHLYMSEFKKNGVLKTRTRLLFKGEKFNLNKFSEYADQSKLLVDGLQYDFREDGSLGSELLYNEEKLQQKTFYYPNGNRQMLISGDEKIMSGEFKTWFLNSQLSFSGNYKDNLKDGEFQQFDQSGKLVKNGIYAGGVLISGEAVVQDIIFKSPDQPAKFPGGDKAFNDYLRMKTAELKIVKDLGKDEVNYINMNLTVSKTGTIDKIDIYGHSIPTDNEILNAAFVTFPGFMPATVENIPVSSILTLELLYTNDGLQSNSRSNRSADDVKGDSLEGPNYVVVEEMPQFPGGERGLQRFIASNLRYPAQAAGNDIQGNVIVNFLVNTDGLISNIKVVFGVNRDLDAEAVRVIRKMPRWKPGRQSGKNVRVSYTVPIKFRIQ